MKLFLSFLFAIFVGDATMAQWISQNSGTNQFLNSVTFTDSNTGYVVGADMNQSAGVILKTTNGGSTWNTLTTVPYCLYAVCFPSPETGYAVGSDNAGAVNVILKTIDGGANWVSVYTGSSGYLYGAYFTDQYTGYVVGMQGTILKTTDGGTTWTTQSLGQLTQFESVYFTSPVTGYAVGQSNEGTHVGLVAKTTDAGLTWTTQFTGNSAPLHCVYFPTANTGYAIGSAGVIFKTTDGGNTWAYINSGTTSYLFGVYFTSENTGYAVGDGIFKTTDGGLNWAYTNTGYLQKVVFTDENTGYIVGPEGIILKTTNGGGVGINTITLGQGSLKTYPCPVQNAFTIEQSSMKGISQLSIFNAEGKKVFVKTLSDIHSQIDVHDLSKGLYLIRLQDGQSVEVGKIIKE